MGLCDFNKIYQLSIKDSKLSGKFYYYSVFIVSGTRCNMKLMPQKSHTV